MKRGIHVPRAAAILLIVAASGCQTLVPKVQVYESPRFLGSQFESIAVIAGADRNSTVEMSVRTRARLNEAGISAHPASGEWDTEAQALVEICRVGARTNDGGTEPVQGVLIVEWNRMTLRECGEQTVAFNIDGGMTGIDRMASRLISYLKGT